MNVPKSFPYACKAGVGVPPGAERVGLARCRILLDADGHCNVHRDGNNFAKSPRPDVVLVKMNLNQRRDAEFVRAGVRQVTRGFERSEQLGREHAQRAEALDRNPLAIRKGRESDLSTPESADSGCPVFGKTGLHSVTIRGLITELQIEGFVLANAHRLVRLDERGVGRKQPRRLVMEFVRKGVKPELANFPWTLFNTHTETCFGQVDVWANDRSPKTGQVVHTVNCGKRDDAAIPQYRLRFADGDWDADVIPLTLDIDA